MNFALPLGSLEKSVSLLIVSSDWQREEGRGNSHKENTMNLKENTPHEVPAVSLRIGNTVQSNKTTSSRYLSRELKSLCIKAINTVGSNSVMGFLTGLSLSFLIRLPIICTE